MYREFPCGCVMREEGNDTICLTHSYVNRSPLQCEEKDGEFWSNCPHCGERSPMSKSMLDLIRNAEFS